GGVEREVDAALVAADEPAPLAVQQAVVDVVLVILLARRQAARRLLRLLGVDEPALAGGLAAEGNDQLALRAAAEAVQEEAAIRLLKDDLRLGAVEAVALQAPRPMGIVQFGEEQGAAVVVPDQAGVAVLEGQFAHLAAGQVLDEQPVDLVAAGVQAVAEQAMVRTDAEGAQRQEAAAGQRVRVEQ